MSFQSGKVGSGMETEYNPLTGGGIKGGGYLQAAVGRIIALGEYMLPTPGIFAGVNSARFS